MNEYVKIKKSSTHSQGLFALKNFEKGEKIYSFKKGKIINADKIKDLTKKEKEYLDKIGDNKYEIIESPGCYINHSCVPNVFEKKRVGYALKDIKKDEELVIDYDNIAHLEKPFKCRCANKNCRKLILGVG